MALHLNPPPSRILLIKPSAIGDVVHALPILNLLRKKWPAAHLSWLVTPACAGLVENHPLVNETILFERHRLYKSPGSLMKLSALLRQRKFDLVIDLQGLFRSGWMAWQTGAPVRLGFANAREFAWFFYTHRVPLHTTEQHAIDRYLAVADALGCGTAPVEFPFAVEDNDRVAVSAMLQDDRPFVLMLPGTNWATKRWPIEHFAALIDPLRDRYGLRTVIAGGPGDVPLALAMLAAVGQPTALAGAGDCAAPLDPACLNLVGKTNLRQTVALIERASLVIANDSGPMHIAAALGRLLVTPYGPTNPVRTGPYRRPETVIRLDLPCSPCYSRTCSHTSCMRWLTPDMMLKQIEPLCTVLTAGIAAPDHAG